MILSNENLKRDLRMRRKIIFGKSLHFGLILNAAEVGVKSYSFDHQIYYKKLVNIV